MQATSLKELMQIRAHFQPDIDYFNYNLGSALGFKKRTGQPISNDPAIIIFVPEKVNNKWLSPDQQIPERFTLPSGLWCYTDVVEGRKVGAVDPDQGVNNALTTRLRGWDDQIWAGAQIAFWEDECKGSYSTGTLGAFAKRKSDGALGFLTNQHVAQNPGTRIYHPNPWAVSLGVTDDSIELVRDDVWYGPFADEKDTWVNVDCAFVKLNNSIKQIDLNAELMGVGEIGDPKEISLDDMSIIGQKVIAVGRTSGVRKGVVAAFGYEYHDEPNDSRYTDLLIIGENDQPFSVPGDSGSLIVTDDHEKRPIGLLWGAWRERLRKGKGQESWAYGTALTHILDELDIELIRRF